MIHTIELSISQTHFGPSVESRSAAKREDEIAGDRPAQTTSNGSCIA